MGDHVAMADEIPIDEQLLREVAGRPLTKRTWREFVFLLTFIPYALLATLIWSMGVSVAATIIGIPLLVFFVWLVRWFAGLERSRLKLVDDEPLTVVYAEPTGNFVERMIIRVSDLQVLKEVGWLFGMSTIGLAVALVGIGVWAIAVGWILYPLWGWAVPGDWTPLFWLTGNDVSFPESFLIVPFGLLMVIVATWVCAGITAVFNVIMRVTLSSSEERILRIRVTDLERSRSEAFTQQSVEMSRIERDLHDGAQARLVALAMDLGMAEQKLGDDPEAAKELIAQAKGEAQTTLQELRDLVRGIGPQILRDRGLEAALVPLAARSSIEVALTIDLPERPSERIETTAYFIASEAMTNAIKHSRAEQINVNVWTHEKWLYLRVSDNGVGGAKMDGEGADGSGLRGLKTRAENVDGRLMVESPTGGPTIIDAWLPMQ